MAVTLIGNKLQVEVLADESTKTQLNDIQQELESHIVDVDNPHEVTAEQVDTYVKTTIDSKDANTLQQAKDYTYRKVEIDNKDTAVMNEVNNLDERIDNIIVGTIEGASAQEIIDARQGEATLGANITKIKTNADIEVMKTYNRKTYQKQINTFTKGTPKPLISFIDDDGHNQVYNRLFPLFQSKNIKGASAIITSQLETGSVISFNQLKEMYNAGWEILGHGHSYVNNLGEFPNDDDLDYQLGDGCKLFLHNLGIETNGFVYPQSYYNLRIKRFTKKYFDFAFGDVGINDNKTFIDTMRINRIAFGYGTGLNPTVNGNSEQDTLAYYKECVDYAVANNAWVVFMLHVGTAEMTESQWQILSDLLDYINTNSVETASPTEAYKHFGNNIFLGDVQAKYMLFNQNGLFSSGGDGHIPFRTVVYNSILSSVGIEGYPLESITKQVCTSGFASANSLPESSAGLLITYHFVGGTVEADFNRQEYWVRNNNNKYVRHAVSLSTWSSWTLINSQKQNYIVSTDNLFPSSEPITSYANDTISSFTVWGAGTSGYPNNASGIVITYKQGGNLYYRQEFKQAGTNRTYSRYVDGTGAWTSWETINLDNTQLRSAFDYSIKQEGNEYSFDDSPSAFPNNKVTSFIVYGAGAVGFPNDSSGIVSVFKQGGNGYNRQEFRPVNTNQIWSRYADSNGDWTAFEKITAV